MKMDRELKERILFADLNSKYDVKKHLETALIYAFSCKGVIEIVEEECMEEEEIRKFFDFCFGAGRYEGWAKAEVDGQLYLIEISFKRSSNK